MQRRQFVGAATGVLTTLGVVGARADGNGEEGVGPINAAVFHASRRFAETGFGRIAYIERGTGPRAALFLHGFPLSGFQWRGALERLSPYRRCIAADFMGLGFTEVPPGQSLEPAAQAQMLASVLDALSVDTVDVVANDSGIAVAQLFATTFSERVRTMLLTNGDVEPDCPPAALLPVIELAKAGRYAEEWLVPWAADPALARSAQGLGGMCYSLPGFPSDDGVACYLTPLVSSPERKALTNAYAVALERNALAGVEPALRRCQAPTKIIWGSADPIFSADSPGYLDRVLPQSRGVRRIETAKLFFPEEYPEIIAEEARALWDVS
jgi:haloalkane dehalogenase